MGMGGWKGWASCRCACAICRENYLFAARAKGSARGTVRMIERMVASDQRPTTGVRASSRTSQRAWHREERMTEGMGRASDHPFFPCVRRRAPPTARAEASRVRNTNANDERACRGLLARELAGKIRRALDAGGDRDGRRPSPPWLRRWLASHDLCWLRQQLALGEDGLRQVHAEFASHRDRLSEAVGDECRREFRMATAPERAVIDALLDDASIETLRSAIRSGTLSGKTALDRAIVHQLLAIDRGSLGALALRCATNLIGSFGAVQPPPPDVLSSYPAVQRARPGSDVHVRVRMQHPVRLPRPWRLRQPCVSVRARVVGSCVRATRVSVRDAIVQRRMPLPMGSSASARRMYTQLSARQHVARHGQVRVQCRLEDGRPHGHVGLHQRRLRSIPMPVRCRLPGSAPPPRARRDVPRPRVEL